jgi:hypothetical protein
LECWSVGLLERLKIPNTIDSGFSVPRYLFAAGGISASLQQVSGPTLHLLFPDT